jgi:hypothetical protein
VAVTILDAIKMYDIIIFLVQHCQLFLSVVIISQTMRKGYLHYHIQYYFLLMGEKILQVATKNAMMMKNDLQTMRTEE